MIGGIQFRMVRRLLPFKANWPYLLTSAAVTRMLTALARVERSRPGNNQNPAYTQEDKYTSLFEKILIEPVGTLSFIGIIHATLDVVAHFAEKRLKIPQLNLDDVIPSYEPQSREIMTRFKQIFHEVYGSDEAGLLDRTIFGDAKRYFVKRKTRDSVKELLGLDGEAAKNFAEKALMPKVDDFIARLNHFGSYAWITAVLVGAAFAGVVLQFVNDRLYAPYVVPFFNKLLGVAGRPADHPQPSFSTALTTQFRQGPVFLPRVPHLTGVPSQPVYRF